MDRCLHQRNQWDVITHPCNSFNGGLVNKITGQLYHTESFYIPLMRAYSLTCGNYLYPCSNHSAVTNHTILLLWRMLSSQSHRKMVLLVAACYCSLRLFSNGSMERAHVSVGRVITYRNTIHIRYVYILLAYWCSENINHAPSQMYFLSMCIARCNNGSGCMKLFVKTLT